MSPVASIFAVACTIFHKDIVSACPHKTKALISLNAGLPHPCTRSKVSPFAMHFLSDFPAHCSSNTWQVFFRFDLPTICDWERAVVKGISALWIWIASAIPTFYCKTFKINKLKLISYNLSSHYSLNAEKSFIARNQTSWSFTVFNCKYK